MESGGEESMELFTLGLHNIGKTDIAIFFFHAIFKENTGKDDLALFGEICNE